MLTINLGAPVLTKKRVEALVRERLPELKDVEFSVSRNSTGEWWWGTEGSGFKHDWSGFVHPDGRVDGPY